MAEASGAGDVPGLSQWSGARVAHREVTSHGFAYVSEKHPLVLAP